MEANKTSMLAARGLTDDHDQLLTADEPLADLQERCGGTIPGTVAVPELLELVRQSRSIGLKLAREFSAFDGEDIVRGFARISPLQDFDGGGCEVLIENWQRAPQSDDNSAEFTERLDAIDRASAEILARLDRNQKAQVWSIMAADGGELRNRADADPRSVWTELVELVGVTHQQPLHWRLLDGVQCKVPGSDREWRARLLPVGGNNTAPSGFELLLIASEPLLAQGDVAPSSSSTPHSGLVGSALTPVLRQPIARVIANAETMRARLAGPLRAEYSEYAGNIASAGQHLAGMLDDLADLEAVEAPGFSTISEAVDLGDVARRAAGILGVRAQDRGIVVASPAKTDAKLIANGEFRRVLQIGINLIGNAIAYSPEGSQVTVTVERESSDMLALGVSDQGPGITEEQASRIFEKFERLGRDNDGGSGLGLYISRRLARAMHGDLVVVRDAEEGAHFKLLLPEATPEN